MLDSKIIHLPSAVMTLRAACSLIVGSDSLKRPQRVLAVQQQAPFHETA